MVTLNLPFIHHHQIPRMSMNQNILLLCVGNMGIYLRCTDGTMPQHPLYIPDIHVLLQQKCRKGMPEHMRGDVLADAGQLRVAEDHIPHRLV